LEAQLLEAQEELRLARLSEKDLQGKLEQSESAALEMNHIIDEAENIRRIMVQKDAKIQLLEEQMANLQDALHQSFSRSSDLEAEVSDLKDSLTTSVHNVEHCYVAKAEYDLLLQRYTRKEAELQEVTGQLANYSRKSTDFNNKNITMLEKKLQEAEEDKKKAAQQLERQVTFYRHIEEEHKKTRKTLVEISDSMRKHESSAPPNDKDQEDVIKLQARVNKLLTTFFEIKAENAALCAKNIDHETQLAQLQKTHSSFEQALLIKGQEHEELQRNISDMQNFVAALEISQADRTSDKISLRSFVHGDLALFTRNTQGFYEALNISSPNYYLSEYSISLLEDKKSSQPFIYGQIVELDKGKADNVHNPYKLPLGTEYHEVTITKVI